MSESERVLADILEQAWREQNEALKAERAADPAWQRCYADPEYKLLERQAAEAMKALPPEWLPPQKLYHPTVSAHFNKILEIEMRYGANRAQGVDRADTRERFQEWIERRGKVQWIMGYSPAVLAGAYERAADLYSSGAVSTAPPQPSVGDVSAADGIVYLQNLKHWATSKNAGDSAGIPADGNADSTDYIDLDQAAALVGRSKRTLERRLSEKKNPMPQADIDRGGGGKKNEWIYATLKPWLEREYARKLPSRPPHSVR